MKHLLILRINISSLLFSLPTLTFTAIFQTSSNTNLDFYSESPPDGDFWGKSEWKKVPSCPLLLALKTDLFSYIIKKEPK